MSDELTKEKHSKRIHDKQTKINKQKKLTKLSCYKNPEDVSDLKEPHRLHKRHAFNCGNPNCFMCGNPRKFFNDETMQEKSFKQRKLHDEK